MTWLTFVAVNSLCRIVIERELLDAGRCRQPEMSPSGGRGDSTSRGPSQESEAYEEGLGQLFDGLPLLGDGYRQGLHADRSAAEAAAQGVEHGPVQPVQP